MCSCDFSTQVPLYQRPHFEVPILDSSFFRPSILVRQVFVPHSIIIFGRFRTRIRVLTLNIDNDFLLQT